jgi:ABC-2 type transport system ATP-binding protein
MYDYNVPGTEIAAGVVAKGLGKRYGDLWALRDVDLYVPAGSVLGLLGHNGAGKTTAIRILTTLAEPTTGSASVAGFDVMSDAARVRTRIGLTSQSATVDGLMSARANLEMFGRLYHLPRALARRRAGELVEQLDLADAAARLVRTFSGGMRRRLDLAASIVASPPVLFLDEPTTGLDPQSRSALWTEVGRLAQEDGVTVFLTTQYLEEADVLADRVGIIDHGCFVAEGTPDDLKAEIGRPTVEVVPADPDERARFLQVLARFGEPAQASPNGVAVRLSAGEAALADVVRALDAENLHVAHLQLHAPSLDDVFLAKTGRTLEGAAAEAEPESLPA